MQPAPPFKLQRCEACSGIFLSPRPRSDDMASVYSDYYAGSREKSPRQEVRAKKHLRRLMRILPTPGHVLEIGAGDGYFLAAARDAGWKVSGLELSQPRVEQARAWFGLELEAKDLQQAAYAPGSFDAVVMFQLIEHVHDPCSILRHAHELLRPGGVLIMSTPNVLTYARKQRGVETWMIPHHLFFFSPLSLINVVDKSGFRVIRRSLLMQAQLEKRLKWQPWSALPLTGALRNLLTPFALRMVARKR